MTKIDHKINIPGYRIIRKIGEGGMSVVYLAFQESLKREVALKIMRPIVSDEENVVRRFEQEAEIIAKLYHPNIVNIYEVGHINDDVLFYSMPYLQHGDLTSVAYQNDEELKQMIAGICDGLAFAHTQGIVHRDIKPENILFDQFGNVQIADFGIALSTGKRRFTKDRKILGSIYYMSPEQAQSKHIDKRSDVYGLGAILFELLTGDPVFDADDDLSIMMAHLSEPIPQLPPELAHWQHVIDKCLAKSPNQRFQNMDSLKQAVLAIEAGSVTSNKSFYRLSAALLFSAFLLMFLYVYIQKDNPSVEVFETPNKQQNTEDESSQEIQKPFFDAGIASSESQQTGAIKAEDLAEQVKEPLLSREEILKLLTKAEQNIANKQLTTPIKNNALDQILLILSHEPNNPSALNLLSEVMAGYYDLLNQAVLKSDMQQANQLADSVIEVRNRTMQANQALLAQLEQNTDLEKSLMISAVVDKIGAAKQALDHQHAEEFIALIEKVIPGQRLADELQDSISTMLKAGQILTDSQGQKTVVITPQYKSKKGLLNYGLAVTQSEITFAQYDAFVRSTGRELKRCKSKLKANMIFSQRNYTKPGFKVNGAMPVVCVTWHDANQYAAWLSQKTGLSYRLPTLNEWRHIDKLSDRSNVCGAANLAGSEFPDKPTKIKLLSCDDGSPHVASTKRYRKDILGLTGLHGNVSEWLAGCEKLGKFKAIFNPDDLCDNNPAIGRSWLSGVDDSGAVQQVKFDQAWTHIGFRLIRDLRQE